MLRHLYLAPAGRTRTPTARSTYSVSEDGVVEVVDDTYIDRVGAGLDTSEGRMTLRTRSSGWPRDVGVEPGR